MSALSPEEEAKEAPVEDRIVMLEIQPGDTYWEGDAMVFTEQYHLRRGYCCGSDCRHCPYK